MRVVMLLTSIQSGEVEAQSIESVDNIEALRQILTARSKTKVCYDEAREVAAALIEFYEILATKESVQDEPTH